jgi:hypothetical protein
LRQCVFPAGSVHLLALSSLRYRSGLARVEQMKAGWSALGPQVIENKDTKAKM